jgi:hypothetical protein
MLVFDSKYPIDRFVKCMVCNFVVRIRTFVRDFCA